MLRYSIAIILTLLSASVFANPPAVVGDWQGMLNIQPGVSLKLVVHIQQDEQGLTSTLDSPQQGSFGIPVASTQYQDNQLRLDISAIGASLVGQLQDGKLVATFSQAQRDLPITLSPLTEEQRQADKDRFARPQTPKPPFTYTSKDVKYDHITEDFSFGATLTIPQGDGPFPLAILVTGSGPQDRDETLAKHKPFWVLADYLSRRGIAVLRADDRGVGESGGDFSKASLNDFVGDIASAYQFAANLDVIDKNAIGIIGHSEGGVTGPMFAAQNPDKVAFLVMLAGLGVDGKELWATQQRDIAVALGANEPQAVYDLHMKAATMAAAGESADTIKAMFDAIPGMNPQQATQIAAMLSSPWGQSFMQYQPASVLTQLTMPLLAVNGDKDIQVSAQPNLDGIKALMASTENKDVEIVELEGLNHLFQAAETGMPNEYIMIQETLNPELLNRVSQWLNRRFVN